MQSQCYLNLVALIGVCETASADSMLFLCYCDYTCLAFRWTICLSRIACVEHGKCIHFEAHTGSYVGPDTLSKTDLISVGPQTEHVLWDSTCASSITFIVVGAMGTAIAGSSHRVKSPRVHLRTHISLLSFIL